MGMSTGKDCPARSGIAVKVASHHLPNVKVEGYTEAWLQNMVDVATRCENYLLCLDYGNIRVIGGRVDLPNATVTLRGTNMFDMRMLPCFSPITLG